MESSPGATWSTGSHKDHKRLSRVTLAFKSNHYIAEPEKDPEQVWFRNIKVWACWGGYSPGATWSTGSHKDHKRLSRVTLAFKSNHYIEELEKDPDRVWSRNIKVWACWGGDSPGATWSTGSHKDHKRLSRVTLAFKSNHYIEELEKDPERVWSRNIKVWACWGGDSPGATWSTGSHKDHKSVSRVTLAFKSNHYIAELEKDPERVWFRNIKVWACWGG